MAATLSPDTITTEILPNFNRELRDNIFMSTAFWEYLWGEVDPVYGGSLIKCEIAYSASPNADVFAGGFAQLNADFVPNATEAVFPPCYYWFSIAIPDTYLILNNNEGMIIDMLAAQYENALMSLNQKLGADVYGDSTPRNGSPTLSGLNSICTANGDPAGGAYGGISRVGMAQSPFTNPSGNAAFWNGNVLTINGGAQTGWKGTVNTGNVTTLSLPALQAFVSLGQVGQFRAKLLLADLLTWNAYHGLLIATIRQAPIAELGQAGFTGIAYADMIMVQDDFCPTGTVYAVNDLLKLRPWAEGFFKQLPWRQPPNQMVNLKYGLLVLNMQHDRPNTMVKMSGITG